MRSGRPWHQAGIIYQEGEDKDQVMLNASHYQLLSSALAVTLRHKIDPENKIGCMLL